MSESFSISLPPSQHNPFVEDENRLLDRLIAQKLVSLSYQPILDLRSRSVFAYEAFCRPRDGYFRTPDELLEAAVRGGRMGALGRYLRAESIAGCTGWPLFLNLNPAEFDDGYIVQPDDPIFAHEHTVYLEISETVPMEFSDECVGILAEVRQRGTRLAIDDFGAGSSSLKYILELEPDFVKLDRELVMNCQPRSREFELLQSVTTLCHRIGAQVIAEGIESADELKAVLAAGIDYGQGFLLSLPQNPPPPIFWPPEVPLGADEYLRLYAPEDETSGRASDSEPGTASGRVPTVPTPTDDPSRTEAALADALEMVSQLQTELERTQSELTDSRAERTLLVEKLKRLSHAPASQPAKPKRTQPTQHSTTIAPSKTETDKTPSVDDALEFVRRLEEERSSDSDR